MRAAEPTGETHEVFNQSPPLVDFNVFECDRALREAVSREGAEWARGWISEVGRIAGDSRTIELGFLANANPPELETHDRFGARTEGVSFHPAYHELLGLSIGQGLHSLPWTSDREGAHTARAAAFICFSQAEAGVGCPTSMTYSVVPALRSQPGLADVWEPRLTSTAYDSRDVEAADKTGALAGMGMTEKQGGSDVRANTTIAEPANGGGPGGEYLISGHKWFMSAPMCDVFLVLAQAPGGISCFLFPRRTPDGELNGFRLQRLKDKLGNRSNASSEVEFTSASGWLVGEEGEGVRTIIEMVNHTRLDCALGGASGMRAATTQAIHHAHHRETFGKPLVAHPLMLNVLADLAIESEAATASAMRLARSYDEASGDGPEAEAARLFKRVANGALKYWICKRAPAHAAEALECLGGNGYVEDSGMPRLFRESPLNSVWEGSGNVQCLDVLRAMARSPQSVEVLFAELESSRGEHPAFDSCLDSLRSELADSSDLEARARRIVEAIALALQGSLLLRYSDPAVASAFCQSRLADPGWGGAFGTLPSGIDFETIVERAAPVPS